MFTGEFVPTTVAYVSIAKVEDNPCSSETAKAMATLDAVVTNTVHNPDGTFCAHQTPGLPTKVDIGYHVAPHPEMDVTPVLEVALKEAMRALPEVTDDGRRTVIAVPVRLLVLPCT
jgi:hypothetical protein